MLDICKTFFYVSENAVLLWNLAHIRRRNFTIIWPLSICISCSSIVIHRRRFSIKIGYIGVLRDLYWQLSGPQLLRFIHIMHILFETKVTRCLFVATVAAGAYFLAIK